MCHIHATLGAVWLLHRQSGIEGGFKFQVQQLTDGATARRLQGRGKVETLAWVRIEPMGDGIQLIGGPVCSLGQGLAQQAIPVPPAESDIFYGDAIVRANCEL